MIMAELHKELSELIGELIGDIDDDYRASIDDEDPSMDLTISTDRVWSRWHYQTGDNSYSGGCYGDPFWGVTTLYRDTDPDDASRDLIEQLVDQIADCPEN